MAHKDISRRTFVEVLAGLGIVAVGGTALEGCGSSQTAASTAASTASSTAASTEASTAASTAASSAASSHKVLVADFSYTGNTWAMAQAIAEATGGDLFRIEPVTPYSDNIDDVYDKAHQEQADNEMPEIKSKVKNFDSYDTVFLGYPLWWTDLPQIVKNFISQYDWAEKTIVPFSSHGGNGWSGTPDTIQQLCPDSYLLTGVTYGEDEVSSSLSEIGPWLESIDYA